jgi:hypothetical protein
MEAAPYASTHWDTLGQVRAGSYDPGNTRRPAPE